MAKVERKVNENRVGEHEVITETYVLGFRGSKEKIELRVKVEVHNGGKWIYLRFKGPFDAYNLLVEGNFVVIQKWEPEQERGLVPPISDLIEPVNKS